MPQTTKSLDTKHIKAAGFGTLKGLISSIPYVGPALIGAWDGYWNSRLEDTIEQLSIKIEELGEEKVDIGYIQSEEFIDLFQKGLRVRLQSRSTQKSKFILGLLTESLKRARDPRFSTALKESFLSVLEQLTDEEMIFLFDFSQGRFREKSKDDIYKWAIQMVSQWTHF